MRTRRFHVHDPVFAQLTVAAVALEFGQLNLTLNPVLRGSKEMVFARQTAMYLLQTTFDMTMTRTAELFGRDRSTVSHALNVIEDSRDDHVFNRKLEKVEDFLIESVALWGEAA